MRVRASLDFDRDQPGGSPRDVCGHIVLSSVAAQGPATCVATPLRTGSLGSGGRRPQVFR